MSCSTHQHKKCPPVIARNVGLGRILSYLFLGICQNSTVFYSWWTYNFFHFVRFNRYFSKAFSIRKMNAFMLNDSYIRWFFFSHDSCPAPGYEEPVDCHRFLKYRSFEGSCNNLKYPTWGNRTQPYSRITARTYSDGTKIRKNKDCL